MVPTYFRRELRDRVLQRRTRPRTFHLLHSREMAEPKSKAELRAVALAAREKLSDKQRTAAAGALAKRGLPMEIIDGLIVSGYSPIRNEIDPEPLMKALASQGARLALPSVNARGKALTFRAWTPGDRLTMGMLGIAEPSTAAARIRPDIWLA